MNIFEAHGKFFKEETVNSLLNEQIRRVCEKVFEQTPPERVHRKIARLCNVAFGKALWKRVFLDLKKREGDAVPGKDSKIFYLRRNFS